MPKSNTTTAAATAAVWRRTHFCARAASDGGRAVMGAILGERPQIGCERGGRLVAVGRVPFHGLADDRLQVLRRPPVCLVQRRGRFDRYFAEQVVAVVAVECGAEREGFVEGRAERVDVRAVVDDAFARGLFGAHVAERAESIATGSQAVVRLDAGQAEVGDEGLAAGVEHDVGRLDVAMDDA